MTALHLVHAVVVGALLSGAAGLIEGALRGSGRGARGVWVAALLLTATAPGWSPFIAPRLGTPLPTAEAAAAPVAAGDGELAPVAGDGAGVVGRVLLTPHPLFGWLWFASGALGVAVVAVGLARIERRARRWPTAKLQGEEVALSHDFGPALVGLRRPRTVLPRWTLGLTEREIALIVAHERAHRHAGDGVALAAALLVAAASPWNPLVWQQLRRLRDAVEMDCDRRVLAAGVPAPAYARVLIMVRLRAVPPGVATAALVESSSTLERRLRTMRGIPWNGRRTVGSLVAAGALIALACETPAPSPVEVEPATDVAHGEALVLERSVEPRGTGPVIYVDGQLVDGSGIDGIAPETIQSVTVLKGEAAAERFGPDARANGAIEIVTKGRPAPGAPTPSADRDAPSGAPLLRPPPPPLELELESAPTQTGGDARVIVTPVLRLVTAGSGGR